MEIFWLAVGVFTLGFAIYSWITDQFTEDLKYMFIAGSMALILGIFRLVYRNHTPTDQSHPKKNN